MTKTNVSRNRLKDKPVRCYTRGGEGWQKHAERSGFALNCKALIETFEKTLLSK